jgi:hypothetical protein
MADTHESPRPLADSLVQLSHDEMLHLHGGAQCFAVFMKADGTDLSMSTIDSQSFPLLSPAG